MQCPSCGFTNPDSMKFCGECGNALKNLCPQCEFENPPGFKFCGECGASLATSPTPRSTQPETHAESPPAEPPTPDAERRQLTVMFCDLADSTKLSGQLDPEDLRDVIRAYQSASAEVIERYDGYIAQHLGDGLMVYFGWPQAHEDDAQRAVHAGLGILEAMARLNARLEQEKGIRLAVRIGIHTGLVVVGEIGQGASQEHLALGETPNVASRIEGIGGLDTVAISDATYQLVQGYFVCEDLGRHTLKGVDDAQQVYRVVRESDVQSRFDVAVTRGLTPLVGREQEVGLLLERWELVKQGLGQVVLLSGEGGIGKSRLVQVLKDHVARESIRLECRSSQYNQNTALYPLANLLERSSQFQADDSADEKLQKLEQMLRQFKLPLEETVPLFATLLAFPLPEDRYAPLNWTPQRQRQKTLESMLAMLLEQTKAQPVLFIFEDVHWLDPSSLELLDLLIDQTPTASIYTLLTHRPEFHPPWRSRSYLTQITLNRLSRQRIEHMAEQVGGGKRLPTDVLQQIVEKTDGVPLFVEEMTKSLLESGMLQVRHDHYEVTGSLTTFAIPTTLQDSLMARLDRLTSAKSIAQLGATIGRQFSYELLQAASQLDATSLQKELYRLVVAELLYQRGLPPQATYTFKHALIQDTAYQSLLRGSRQQYHKRIAEVLGEHFAALAEQQPEVLAHHYTEAGLAGPAVRYWRQAGVQAAQRSAHREASYHLRKALDLVATLPETPERNQQELELQTALGPALMATRGYADPEVLQTYTRARELCQQIGETPQLFPVLRGLWNFNLIRLELQTAREQGEQLLSLAQQADDPALLLEAHYALGNTLNYLGEFVSAKSHFAHGIDLYDPQQHHIHAVRYAQDPGVVCRAYAGMTLWYLGYPDQALQHSHAALRLAHELSHPYSLGYALFFAAILHHLRREWQLTQERAEAVIALGSEQGFALWVAGGTLFRGWALAQPYLTSGTDPQQHEAAMAQVQQSLAAWRATGAEVLRPYGLAMLAEAYIRTEQPEAGLPLLDEAVTLTNDKRERRWEAELYRLKGELLLQAAGETGNAELTPEDYFHQALSVARRQQAKSWELRAATSLARLWQSQGKRREAYELLEPVYGWFTEGFDTADLKDAKELLMELEHR